MNHEVLSHKHEINESTQALDTSPPPKEKISDSIYFLETIGRPDLKEVLTLQSPFVYASMEFYDQKLGIKGGGGLGVLAGDTRELAEGLDMPMTVLTPFYTKESRQTVSFNSFINKDRQKIEQFDQDYPLDDVRPEDRGFTKFETNLTLKSRSSKETQVEIYQKSLGSTNVISPYHPDMAELYHGGNNSGHRLFQELSTGFVGYHALKELKQVPSLIQLNEAPSVFVATAMLDDLVQQSIPFPEALEKVKKKTLYTNHTLVQAVEAEFTGDQFAEQVMPNIQSEEVEAWIWNLFKDDKIKLSTIAIELSGRKNGVSKLHAVEASKQYRDASGNLVNFEAVTNGISDRWVLPGFVELDSRVGIVDGHGLPGEEYPKNIAALDAAEEIIIKTQGRQHMNEVLSRRVNQYGEPVQIPQDAKVFTFKKRFAGYKRPDIFFEDQQKLAEILEQSNSYLLISGKPHPDDNPMQGNLNNMLNFIHNNPVLKERVHYLPDYDEELGYALSVGADISLNAPIPGKEACGTSVFKDIRNRVLVISTNDGGLADTQPPACLEIEGENYIEEVASVYDKMGLALEILADPARWKEATDRQLLSYPNIYGAQMVKEYIDLGFPKEISGQADEEKANEENIVYESVSHTVAVS
jgi:alpha-glucan phosphorylase-like protein